MSLYYYLAISYESNIYLILLYSYMYVFQLNIVHGKPICSLSQLCFYLAVFIKIGILEKADGNINVETNDNYTKLKKARPTFSTDTFY